MRQRQAYHSHRFDTVAIATGFINSGIAVQIVYYNVDEHERVSGGVAVRRRMAQLQVLNIFDYSTGRKGRSIAVASSTWSTSRFTPFAAFED